MNLEITKERVLEASKQSYEAKAVLQGLFPDAFKAQNVDIPFFSINSLTGEMIYVGRAYAPRGLSGKCFILSADYDWEIVKEDGRIVLIPTTK